MDAELKAVLDELMGIHHELDRKIQMIDNKLLVINKLISQEKPITIKEFADKSNFSVSKVKRHLDAGLIQQVPISKGKNGKILIPKSELLKVLG